MTNWLLTHFLYDSKNYIDHLITDQVPDGVKPTDDVKPITFSSIQQAVDAFGLYFSKETKANPDLKE